MCVWQDADVPVPDQRALAYFAGYADGVKAALSGMAQPMCSKHSSIRDRMLVRRGLMPLRTVPTIKPTHPASAAARSSASSEASGNGTTGPGEGGEDDG